MKFNYLILSIISILLMSCAGCFKSGGKEDSTAVRIGTFDSRAVAIAWAGTEQFEMKMKELHSSSEKAKEAGDEETVKELEMKAQKMQMKLHQMGFSTAPVTDILLHIEDQFPRIMEEAGVVTIVSKWDEDALAKHMGAKHVDVTEALVDALKPNAKQKKSAMEIMKTDPTPLDELDHDH